MESNLNTAAVSPKGAQGAMQLMPATAARYGLKDAHAWRDPERNIDAGVRHLKDLLAQYQGNVALALAAYNAGSGAVARHGSRIPPYRETMLYVPAGVHAHNGTGDFDLDRRSGWRCSLHHCGTSLGRTWGRRYDHR